MHPEKSRGFNFRQCVLCFQSRDVLITLSNIYDLTTNSRSLFSQKALLKMFDKVLNTHLKRDITVIYSIPFLYALKTLENIQFFSDIVRGYRNRTLA